MLDHGQSKTSDTRDPRDFGPFFCGDAETVAKKFEVNHPFTSLFRRSIRIVESLMSGMSDTRFA